MLQILTYVRQLFLNHLSAVRKFLIYVFPLWKHHNFFLSSILHSVTGGWIRGSNPSGGEIFRTRPDRPRRRSSLLYKGYQLSSPVIATGAWPSPPTPSNDEDKERVQLYLYLPICTCMARYRVTFTWLQNRIKDAPTLEMSASFNVGSLSFCTLNY